MKPKDFVKLYLPYALIAQKKTGINAVAVLAQAALESGWGNAAPGNAFFGVKDTDGKNGNEQLLTTTEYSRRQDLKFPVIISVSMVMLHGNKMFKYTVKDYFRKYETPADCFTDHSNFFLNNPRYKTALLNKSDAIKFANSIAVAGYGTDPNYGSTLVKIINMITPFVK